MVDLDPSGARKRWPVHDARTTDMPNLQAYVAKSNHDTLAEKKRGTAPPIPQLVPCVNRWAPATGRTHEAAWSV